MYVYSAMGIGGGRNMVGWVSHGPRSISDGWATIHFYSVFCFYVTGFMHAYGNKRI